MIRMFENNCCLVGSGDAQTLCITDDDNVWAWGDGDYGKLGRGGSEGCKVPMKVESLAGMGRCSAPSISVTAKLWRRCFTLRFSRIYKAASTSWHDPYSAEILYPHVLIVVLYSHLGHCSSIPFSVQEWWCIFERTCRSRQGGVRISVLCGSDS